MGGACAWLGERSEPTCSSQAHAPISRGNMKGHLGNIEEHGDGKKPRVYISPILKRIVLHTFRYCGIMRLKR